MKGNYIEKAMMNKENFQRSEYYYDSARESMFDLLKSMHSAGVLNKIFLPGYIGWSPREGSGIFDPINNLEGVSVAYYKMTSDLDVDFHDLYSKISFVENGNFAVLVVNYFGFVDDHIAEIADLVKSKSGWLIEDNAHGFFTHNLMEKTYSDATFFSLHKMFPFENGGSIKILNKKLDNMKLSGSKESNNNPWIYDVYGISRKRRLNYTNLDKIIKGYNTAEYFRPLKKDSITNFTVPQTYPIKIIKGDRNVIYDKMNEAGYGVISLYHTLIEPLRSEEYKESYELSRCIMNLPVHQDVDITLYENMINLLIKLCKDTGNN